MPAAAQMTATHDLQSLPGSTLSIRGSTTIGASWQCASTDIVAVVSIADRPADHAASLPDVRTVTIRVPVAGLHCQNGAMEGAMTHALKADSDSAAQVISGRFEARDDTLPRGAGAMELTGTLRVAGADRAVSLHSVVVAAADGSISVHSELPLTLSSFGIAPPRLLFGMVRARDAVTIEVDLRFAALTVVTPP